MAKRKPTKRKQASELRCVWGLTCSLSSIDQEKNNISLFNIIEQINFPKERYNKLPKEEKDKPILLPHEIVLLWRRTLNISYSENEILTDMKLMLVDPTGKIIQETVAPLKLPKGTRRLRYRVQVPGLKFTTSGDYVYRVAVRQPLEEKFKTELEIPLEINLV